MFKLATLFVLGLIFIEAVEAKAASIFVNNKTGGAITLGLSELNKTKIDRNSLLSKKTISNTITIPSSKSGTATLNSNASTLILYVASIDKPKFCQVTIRSGDKVVTITEPKNYFVSAAIAGKDNNIICKVTI